MKTDQTSKTICIYYNNYGNEVINLSAKDEVKEIFLKKFGPASASLLDSIKATNDAAFVQEAYQLLSRKMGESTAKSFLEGTLNKYK